MSNRNRSTTQAQDAQVIAGIKKDLTNVQTLSLAGTQYTTPALTQLVQSRIDSGNAVATAKANWLHAAAAYETLDAQVTKVVRGLKQYVINTFGEDSPQLADFGFTSAKRKVLNTAEQSTKIAKLKATRTARNTMGKVQKKSIKGNVVGVTVTPVVAPTPTAKADGTGTSGASAAVGSGGPTGPSGGGSPPATTTGTTAPTVTASPAHTATVS